MLGHSNIQLYRLLLYPQPQKKLGLYRTTNVQQASNFKFVKF